MKMNSESDELRKLLQVILPMSEMSDHPWSDSEMRGLARQHIEKIVSAQLIAIGISPHLVGYGYLRTAVLYVLQQLTVCVTVPSPYGVAVAKQYGASVTGVERAIRNALSITWNQAAPDSLFRGMFQFRPTNREFILLLAEKLRIRFY